MKIVCICPSYGRPRTTEMSAWMFLQQNNPHARLYILDDSGTYSSEYDDFNIVLKLHESRFPSLSDKYNYMIKQAKDWFNPDIFMVWENDDWYFPWHIGSYIPAFIESNVDFVHADHVYMADNKAISISPTNKVRFHASLAFSARIAKDNLYPPPAFKGFDVVLLERLNRTYVRGTPATLENLYSYCWYCNNPEFPQGSSWSSLSVHEQDWYRRLGAHAVSKGNTFSPRLFDAYVNVINRLLPGSIDVDNNRWDVEALKRNLSYSGSFIKRTLWSKG